MEELYKGYTQHLRSTTNDDVTPGAIFRMEMIPGLFVMKKIQQEGYVLPVCKYINNLRKDYIGGFSAITPGLCHHPKFDWATIENTDIKLQNMELIPSTIAGGIVSINNLMRTRTIPRYEDFTNSNLLKLEETGDIIVLKSFIDMQAQAYILLIKNSCKLVCEHLTYNFTIHKYDGTPIDFTATIE